MDQEEEIQPGGTAGWAGYVVVLVAIAAIAITITAAASGFAGAWLTGVGIAVALLLLGAGIMLFLSASRELGRDRIEAQRKAANTRPAPTHTQTRPASTGQTPGRS